MLTWSCYDVDFNVRRGAEYLAQVIAQNEGNALAGLAAYNGLAKGMTLGDVYKMKDEGRCFAQVSVTKRYTFKDSTNLSPTSTTSSRCATAGCRARSATRLASTVSASLVAG